MNESFDSEFGNHIFFVKEDDTILWMLRCIPRSRFGTRFVAWLILKISEMKTGTKTIRDKVEECLGQGKYNLRLTTDLMEFARTIGQKDDPIWIETTRRNMTHDETDHSKRVLCKFIRTGCVYDTTCSFSHHPSMIWKEICSLSGKKWYSCDFPQDLYGLIFRLSRDFEYEFSVIICVPRKMQVEAEKNCMVQIKGDEEDVRNCVISLRKKISTHRDGQERNYLYARNFVESVVKRCHTDQEKRKDATPDEGYDSDDTTDSDEPKVLDTVVEIRDRIPEKREIRDPKKHRSDVEGECSASTTHSFKGSSRRTDSSDEPEVSDVVEPIVRKRHRNPEKHAIRDPKKRSHGSVDDEPKVLENKRSTGGVDPAREMYTNDGLFLTLMQLPEAKRRRTMWKIVQEVPIEMLKDAIRTRKKWSNDLSV